MGDKYILIKNECLQSRTTNPIELALSIMKNEGINMHGPEHHVLDGSAFLTAMHNAGVEFDLEKALDEMAVRGQRMPGATCGQWGMCGSTTSVGAALAIIHETGPLSSNQYYKDNMNLVSQALGQLAKIGGPRCCKRNAFLSLMTAIDFVKEHYGVELTRQNVECEFSRKNQQCIGRKCPFFKENSNDEEV